MKNVRRDRYGLRAYVKVGAHPQVEKRFKRGTTRKKIMAWLDETRVALRKTTREFRSVGTLRDDVTRYLRQVSAMPTAEERERHLDLWIAALGSETLRSRITAADIRTVLQRWRQTHEAATCNKRRTALMHLWTLLDGKGASNPVRDVPKFRVSDPLPRGRDPHVVDRALLTAPRCRSRASCRVMLWTGMRPAELNRAEADDVNLPLRTAIIRTAKGGKVRVIPLTPQAVAAWKEFNAEDCWKRVPQAAPLNRWLQKITGLEMRVYDLRHSYGTALARSQTRLDVIGSLMGHSTLELTKRYTLAAVTPDALSATNRLAVPLAVAKSRNKSR